MEHGSARAGRRRSVPHVRVSISGWDITSGVATSAGRAIASPSSGWTTSAPLQEWTGRHHQAPHAEYLQFYEASYAVGEAPCHRSSPAGVPR
jgi:hypothetical protein